MDDCPLNIVIFHCDHEIPPLSAKNPLVFDQEPNDFGSWGSRLEGLKFVSNP